MLATSDDDKENKYMGGCRYAPTCENSKEDNKIQFATTVDNSRESLNSELNSDSICSFLTIVLQCFTVEFDRPGVQESHSWAIQKGDHPGPKECTLVQCLRCISFKCILSKWVAFGTS